MALTPERKGEIAYAFIKGMVRQEGISKPLVDKIARHIKDVAAHPELNDARVTKKEAAEFAQCLLQETCDELARDLVLVK